MRNRITAAVRMTFRRNDLFERRQCFVMTLSKACVYAGIVLFAGFGIRPSRVSRVYVTLYPVILRHPGFPYVFPIRCIRKCVYKRSGFYRRTRRIFKRLPVYRYAFGGVCVGHDGTRKRNHLVGRARRFVSHAVENRFVVKQSARHVSPAYRVSFAVHYHGFVSIFVYLFSYRHIAAVGSRIKYLVERFKVVHNVHKPRYGAYEQIARNYIAARVEVLRNVLRGVLYSDLITGMFRLESGFHVFKPIDSHTAAVILDLEFVFGFFLFAACE